MACKWPYNLVTGVITPISGVGTQLITGRGQQFTDIHSNYTCSGFPIKIKLIHFIHHPPFFPATTSSHSFFWLNIFGTDKNPAKQTWETFRFSASSPNLPDSPKPAPRVFRGSVHDLIPSHQAQSEIPVRRKLWWKSRSPKNKQLSSEYIYIIYIYQLYHIS